MTTRSLAIHGHFYQPPREDPLTGLIPSEEGATPYNNWNERVHAECYRPNAKLGNFGRMSFNVGPTLFSWIAEHDSETYRRIIEQDRGNVRRFGAGNAIAQAYNHTILPLASYTDKVTQVVWGIADFAYRFGRAPRGMWLPEAAVDTATLAVLADHGIEFTILAPWQAGDDDVDTSVPYRVNLPGGRSIVVFFYDRDLSGRVSFDPGITINAENFVLNDLTCRFSKQKRIEDEPQIVLVASDGELYGHHQEFRDKFLSHLLNGASTSAGIVPTYPARWLNEHPVTRTIQIRDKTSWSCHHGVVRWAGECGCAPSGGRWKANLRYAMNRLAIELDRVYVDSVEPMISDPWQLRNEYIHVVLGECSAEDLIYSHAGSRLSDAHIRKVQTLLRAQYERQRMFTSCGWFFDDFDRIEPRNNVAYAAQAVWLTSVATDIDLTSMAVQGLCRVRSPRTDLRADTVFLRHLARAKETMTII